MNDVGNNGVKHLLRDIVRRKRSIREMEENKYSEKLIAHM